MDEANRDYRVAFKSAHISGQRAALMADLAVAPIPLSCCVNGIVELTEKHGFPAMRDYGLGMVVQSDASASVMAAAQHLRDSFSSLAA